MLNFESNSPMQPLQTIVLAKESGWFYVKLWWFIAVYREPIRSNSLRPWANESSFVLGITSIYIYVCMCGCLQHNAVAKYIAESAIYAVKGTHTHTHTHILVTEIGFIPHMQKQKFYN